MSDDRQEQQCRRHADNLPELALGVLTGRERAEALSHVESCPRCADELEQLSRAGRHGGPGWRPTIEPPVGFEVRLFERMGVTADPSRPRRLRRIRRIRPAYWVPAAVAAAAVAGPRSRAGPRRVVALRPPWRRARTQPKVRAAALVENGQTVGRVSDLRRRQAVDVDDAGRLERARDGQLRRRDRRRRDTHQVGTFVASERLRGLGGPLTVEPPPTSARAEVVSPSGTVIATATLG